MKALFSAWHRFVIGSSWKEDICRMLFGEGDPVIGPVLTRLGTSAAEVASTAVKVARHLGDGKI